MKTSEGAWYYEQIDLGFNYRMTDIQAALGLSQSKRLEEFISKRHRIAAKYHQELSHLPIILPWQCPNGYSSFHLYVIQVQDGCGIKRKELFDRMRKFGIFVNVHYIPIHTQPYFASKGFKKGDYPIAEKYYENALSLPLFVDLNESDHDQVLSCLKEALA